MTKTSLLLLCTLVTLLSVVDVGQSYYHCQNDDQCTFHDDTLRCNWVKQRCECKSGYIQTETETPGFYSIACSYSRIGAIVGAVVGVVGFIIVVVVVTMYMKRRRMGCFA